MTNPYTPEKVAELITEAREKGRNNISKGITLNDRLADALTAVSAERDTAIRQRDAAEKQVEIRANDSIASRIARSNVRAVEEWAATQELLAKQTRYIEELESVDSVGLRADRDRLHKAITEALELHQAKKIRESDRAYTLICSHCELRAYPCESARILRAALDKEGNDDE